MHLPIGTESAHRRMPRHEAKVSPSNRKIAEFGAAERAAFSAMASSTGWRSVGELEMTRRISLVAVCCSRASVTCACAP